MHSDNMISYEYVKGVHMLKIVTVRTKAVCDSSGWDVMALSLIDTYHIFYPENLGSRFLTRS
jgi:hypothetical protein